VRVPSRSQTGSGVVLLCWPRAWSEHTGILNPHVSNIQCGAPRKSGFIGWLAYARLTPCRSLPGMRSFSDIAAAGDRSAVPLEVCAIVRYASGKKKACSRL